MSRTTRPRSEHAIVVGASIAGLATARVLSSYFEHVTVLDRDQFPESHEPRQAVPQGRHAHALLGGGVRAITELFPGIMEEMVEGGATLVDFNLGRWYQAGGHRAPLLIHGDIIGASRPFIEGHIRRRTEALPNVTIETGISVSGLAHDGARVRGVVIEDGGSPRTLRADLVIDCSGRGSRADRWLTEIGYDAPEVVEVSCDVRYATVMLRRSPSDFDAQFGIVIETPPHGKRAGFVLPVEGDRWIMTIASSFGATAPNDIESFRTIAASLPSPELADVLAVAQPLTPVMNHRLPSSRRHRYEKQRRVPTGFVALGDSICSFNPIYGQGMSSAVLQAVELGEVLRTRGVEDGLARAFYKRAAKVIATPWQIAVGADFAYPECTGPKPIGTDMANRYMAKVLVAAEYSPEINTQMILVQNLLAKPSTLFKPSMIRKVRRATRRVPVVAQTPSSSPAHQKAA